MKSKKLELVSAYWMVLLLVASSNFALAQVSASISGRIEDGSGAIIPGATLTVTSLETGAARTVTTDDAGSYRVLSLPVGQYQVRAEKTGFKAVVHKGISLAVGQQATVNLTLEVGEVQQQVTVTAEAPLVNTSTASVAGLVGEQQVKDLPLNGRSFDNLITLNAGALNYTANTNAAGSGSGLGSSFSVAGRRPNENLFLLNGVEYTGASLVIVTAGGASGELLGIDAVREFNVVNNDYSAEYGKRPGAQISIVTQSGTNQFHGSVFEFLRNDALDARNFFDKGGIPAFRRNNFGGSAGGPVRKDKTFVFGSYEGLRERLGISSVAVVPDNNARRGLLPDAQGVPTPVAGLERGMLPYMAFWPEPNGDTLGQGFALSFNNPTQKVREDFGTLRLDHTFSDSDSLSGSYTVDDGEKLAPRVDPLFANDMALRMQVASLQETHIFSPQMINTARVGFSRAGFGFRSPTLVPIPSSLSFVTGRGPGGFNIGGTSSGTSAATFTPAGANVFPVADVARSLFTAEDGLQVVKGKHQISAGGWFQAIRSNEFGLTRPWGQASFATLQSFLQGTIRSLSVALNPIPLAWRSREGAWYLQDVIQVRPNLTLRLGLRHEFTNGWNEATNRAPNFFFGPDGVLLTDPVVRGALLTENNAKKLFGPRIGLSWDPFGTGKTTIRAGFGTYYHLMDALGFPPGSVPPNNGLITFANVPLLSVVPISPTLAPPPTCGPGVPAPCTTFATQGADPTLKTPTVESWNFTVERQLTPNMALRVAYVGSFGYHDITNADPNVVHSQICANPAGCPSGGILAAASRATVPQGAEYFPVGTRPNPFLADGFYWFSEGNSSYNALQVELNRRLGQGLQFKVNYTWSKNLDVGSATSSSQGTNQPGSVLDRFNLRRDWGPSALTVTNQGSANFSYELPLGRGQAWLNGVSGVADKLVSDWQINGIVTLLSGFPFTPQIGSNLSGNGDTRNSGRPNANPAFSGPKIIGSPQRWFDPNAYVLPTAGTNGNVGRGVLTGPGMAALDFSLFKRFRISERIGLQFRAEFFNLFNRANFGSPSPIVFSGSTFSPAAGVLTSTATTSRQIQFGLKLTF